MTNKQERFFVVSESELFRALSAAELVGTGPEFMRKTLIETREIAEAACRTRPVPKGATHFYARHGEPSSGYYETPIGWFKEIKK